MLIFDEATSALDYESERIIQDNMRQICQGPHRVRDRASPDRGEAADRIIMLDKGEIIEEGSHRELLERHGHYANLYRYQAA